MGELRSSDKFSARRVHKRITNFLEHFPPDAVYHSGIHPTTHIQYEIQTSRSLHRCGGRVRCGCPPSLTILQPEFAVVRDTIPLDLKSGVNAFRYADATAQVEADSVILARPGGQADAADPGAELPQRSRVAGIAAVAVRGADD